MYPTPSGAGDEPRRRSTADVPSDFGPEFACSVDRHGERVALVLSGELDLASAEVFQDATTRVLETPVSVLVVDLRELRFIDSSGLRAVLRLQKRLPEATQLELLPGRPAVQRVFELAGLTAVLPFRVA